MKNEKTYPEKTKVTLYRKCEFMGNVVADKCYLLRTFNADYAQYKDVFHVDIQPKGKRSAYRFRATGNALLIVVEGWDNPEPPSEFIEIESKIPGVVCKSSKYSCFDKRYISDFLEVYQTIQPEKTMFYEVIK